MKYNDLDCAIKQCLQLIKETGLEPELFTSQIHFSKSDLSNAYRVVPVKISHGFLLVMKVQHPETDQEWYFIDLCLWPAELMVFLGLLLNGRTLTINIPTEKLVKANNLLDWALHKKKVTIKFIQSLTGTLNFLNKAIIPGGTFTRMMYTKLRTKDNKGNLLKQYHYMKLDKEFLEDCKMWKVFLGNTCIDPTLLCRTIHRFQ